MVILLNERLSMYEECLRIATSKSKCSSIIIVAIFTKVIIGSTEFVFCSIMDDRIAIIVLLDTKPS